MAATLLGEAADLLPVFDGENHQDTGATGCQQPVFYDTTNQGDVTSGLIQINQAS